MFKIRDTQTQEWLHHLPYGNRLQVVQGEHTVSKGTGKIFKRRGDVSVHIGLNSIFYKHHAQRFEVVEFQMVEAAQHTMETFLTAKSQRDKIKQAKIELLQAEYKQAEINRLQAELAKLTGNKGTP